MFKNRFEKPIIHEVGFILLNIILLIPIILFPFLNMVSAAAVSTNEKLATTGAKSLAQLNQALNNLSIDASTAASAPSRQITVNSDQDQDFFTPQGTAQIIPDVNGNGTWSQIQLTNANAQLNTAYPTGQNQSGAVTLNTRIDMTQPFHFSWQVNLIPGTTPMADGIGFVLHPTYIPGSTQPTTTAIDSGQPVDHPQKITSYGLPGGNVGTSDLMNAWGFKIDSWYNVGYLPGAISGSYFGDPRHENFLTPGSQPPQPDSYAMPDSYLGTTQQSNWATTDMTKQWGPYGTFTTTDSTGYMSFPPANTSWPLPPFELSVLDGSWNHPNVTSTNGAKFTMNYTPNSNGNPTLQVIITNDDGSEPINYTRTLSDTEEQTISQRQFYAFAIEGSTGQYTSTQSVQDISGAFTPESPTLIERWATADGSPLAASKTLSPTYTGMPNTNGQVNATASTTIVSDTAPTQGFSGVLSHIILTTYKNTQGTPSVVRVSANDPNLINNNGTWSYNGLSAASVAPITIITFVYRQNNNLPSFKIAYSPPGGGSTTTIQPNATVNATATVTGATVNETTTSTAATGQSAPYALPNVQILDEIPGQFQLVSSSKDANKNAQVTMSNNNTQLNMNFGKVSAGTSVSVTYTLKYVGTHATSLVDSAYMYDGSVNNINTTPSTNDQRNFVTSSYYYQDSTTNAPLAAATSKNMPLDTNTYKNMDPGNYVPYFGSQPTKAEIDVHYWSISAGATTMDPIQSGHPTTEINNNAGNFTDIIGDSIVKSPVAIPGYTYLGYYEYDGIGTSSTWHAAGTGNTIGSQLTFYYQVPQSQTPVQQVAFIYAPDTKILQVPDLNFGTHNTKLLTNAAFSTQSTNTAILQVTDPRQAVSLPSAMGSWQLTVSAQAPFIGVNTHKQLTGANIIFPPANLTGTSGVVTQTLLPNNNSSLPIPDSVGASNTLSLAVGSGYNNATLTWPLGALTLNLPQQAQASSDRYQTTLTWNLTTGL